MSDIVIMGANLPPKGKVINFSIGSDGTVLDYMEGEVEANYGRFIAIEIPKHGRLVDADKIDTTLDLEFMDENGRTVKSLLRWNALDHAPTIIEPSGSPLILENRRKKAESPSLT